MVPASSSLGATPGASSTRTASCLSRSALSSTNRTNLPAGVEKGAGGGGAGSEAQRMVVGVERGG